uniref:Uncharacterized protein n=1 Tax=Helianthus annuus TaxID=4232 RepID=A0A251U545_HELAN
MCKSYLYLLGGIRLGLNLYLAQVNTFNLFSLYGLGVRYIKYRLVGELTLTGLGYVQSN